MPTVALVSRKGGCGKSTLATNIAAYFARRGVPITLGDLDHQQSMRVWLKRRPSAAPAITGWVGDTNGHVRPPVDGLHGLGLAKVAMVADAILIPVAGSVFDRESASDCWHELRTHPRVVSGRCQVSAIGMRFDRRTPVEVVAIDWAASINLPWLCSLRSSQIYVRAVENGLSIFDMPPSVTATDRAEWQPLLQWLMDGAFAPVVDEVPTVARGVPSRLPQSPAVLRVMPRGSSPLLEPVTAKPSVVSPFARFVPRFLRPRLG